MSVFDAMSIELHECCRLVLEDTKKVEKAIKKRVKSVRMDLSEHKSESVTVEFELKGLMERFVLDRSDATKCSRAIVKRNLDWDVPEEMQQKQQRVAAPPAKAKASSLRVLDSEDLQLQQSAADAAQLAVQRAAEEQRQRDLDFGMDCNLEDLKRGEVAAEEDVWDDLEGKVGQSPHFHFHISLILNRCLWYASTDLVPNQHNTARTTLRSLPVDSEVASCVRRTLKLRVYSPVAVSAAQSGTPLDPKAGSVVVSVEVLCFSLGEDCEQSVHCSAGELLDEVCAQLWHRQQAGPEQTEIQGGLWLPTHLVVEGVQFHRREFQFTFVCAAVVTLSPDSTVQLPPPPTGDQRVKLLRVNCETHPAALRFMRRVREVFVECDKVGFLL